MATTDADGHTTYFGDDESHRMVFQEYPNGLRFHYRYDKVGRCFESWGQTASHDPAVASGLAETLADGVTAAKGIFHCKQEFGDDYTEVVDSRRLRRFLKGDGKGLGMAVNGVGGVTTRTYDALGRIASHTNAVGATFEYEYDDQDRITRDYTWRQPPGAGGRLQTVTYPGTGEPTFHEHHLGLLDPRFGQRGLQRHEK